MINSCFDLLDKYIEANNINYDLIIKLRTDIYYDKLIINNLSLNNSINLFVRGDITFNEKKLIYTNDTCSFGNLNMMREFCKLGDINRFMFCSKIAKEICSNKKKIIIKGGACHINFVGELLMTINLNYFDIPIYKHQINYGLIRSRPKYLETL